MNILLSVIGGFVIAASLAVIASLTLTIDTAAVALTFVSLAGAAATMTALRHFGFRQPARVAIMAMICLGAFAFSRFELPHSGATVAAVASEVESSAVKRGWDGHFRANASVNGSTVEMLVDTGASIVLLTYEDAARAGLDLGALEFDVPVLTANGRSHVASITLDALAIGAVEVANVRAAVAQQGQLHASLLGMSFIGEIAEAVIRKDELILRN